MLPLPPSDVIADVATTLLFPEEPLVRALLVPELLPDDILAQQLDLATVVKYPGFKEEVYVRDFKPDRSFLNRLNIDASQVLITIRPPADEAHYHNPESDSLLDAVLARLLHKPNVVLLLLPRTRKQKEHILNLVKKKPTGKIIIPSGVINGLDLIWHSDLVISGGGTMNREAAVLGVPAYSIFRGKSGAIDRFLAERGKLTFIKDVDDFNMIRIKKRDKSQKVFAESNLCTYLIDEIIRGI